jgi:RNA polymerase sigma factor (sigma-70 family)
VHSDRLRYWVLLFSNGNKLIEAALNIQNKSILDRSLSAQNDLHVLINECIGQSRHAQKRMYERFAPFAFGIIKRYEYNEQSAQEILNDAFFKIFTKLEQYAFTGSFEGWIRRIIVNSVTDHIRKYVKETKVHKVEAEPFHAFTESESLGKLSYKELLGLVHTLPDTQRAVFNLFVFESLSHKEIGICLAMNENNSKWHLNDARRRLKEKLIKLK